MTRSTIAALALAWLLSTAASAQIYPALSGQPLLDAIADQYTPDTVL